MVVQSSGLMKCSPVVVKVKFGLTDSFNARFIRARGFGRKLLHPCTPSTTSPNALGMEGSTLFAKCASPFTLK